MNFLPQGSNPKTAGFTCNTCGIRFSTAELQRQHMRTDWHRYNLKRRVSGLPSIPSEVFAEKVLASMKTHDEAPNEDEYGFHVSTRRKSLGQRQLTKKDLKRLARNQLRGRAYLSTNAAREYSPAASVASELSEFSLGSSSVPTTDIDSNYDTVSEAHMSDGSEWSSHVHESMDESWESDYEDESSDDELQEALPNHYCFYCGKNNREVEQNIKHMTKYHGLYIPQRSFLTDLEGLLTFINEVTTTDHECLTCGFEGKSLESIRQHLLTKGHCRIPYETKQEREVIAEFYDFDSFYSAKEKKLKTKSVSFGPPEDNDSDSDDAVSTSKSVVVLPNGSRLGHRSMTRYHRPSLLVEREVPDGPKTVALMDRRFAPGLTGHLITKLEKEQRKLETRVKNLHERRTKAKKANYQRYYRDELLQ